MSKNLPMPLSEKEKSVLEFIEIQIAETGVSPSYQEIKDHFGFASFNSVQNYIKQLSQKGYIQIPSHQKRAIQVIHSHQTVQKLVQQKITPVPKSVSSRASTQKSESLLPASDERGEIFSLPLLGKVAAGRPIEAYSHDEFVEVPPSLVRNPTKTFALKVAGASMIEDGIFDGDVILVQKQQSASNGETIVATVDNESTVKRFYMASHPQKKDQQKWVELRPANSTMSSMWYPPDQVQIQGVVVGLIRKF